MKDTVLLDYDAQFDILKIVLDGKKDSHGMDFPGGVVLRGIEDDSVTGVLLWNASKVIHRNKENSAQRNDGVVGGSVGSVVDAARKKAVVYTDGSCLDNPGPGGWASIVEIDGESVELSGGEAQTTNNRMELLAVIHALERIGEPSSVLVYADSQYVINGIEKGWAKNWRKNGWIKSDKKPALNAELWDRLLTLCEFHEVKFQWVKGHAGNEKNERCDELAQKAARAQR